MRVDGCYTYGFFSESDFSSFRLGDIMDSYVLFKLKFCGISNYVNAYDVSGFNEGDSLSSILVYYPKFIQYDPV